MCLLNRISKRTNSSQNDLNEVFSIYAPTAIGKVTVEVREHTGARGLVALHLANSLREEAACHVASALMENRSVREDACYSFIPPFYC
jgi:hypothetical protein